MTELNIAYYLLLAIAAFLLYHSISSCRGHGFRVGVKDSVNQNNSYMDIRCENTTGVCYGENCSNTAKNRIKHGYIGYQPTSSFKCCDTDNECRDRDYQNSFDLAEQVECSILPGNSCLAYGSQCPDGVFVRCGVNLKCDDDNHTCEPIPEVII